MSMTPFLVPTAESGPEQLWDLPMPAWAYGAIAVVLAVLLLLLVWAFRNVAGNVIYGPAGPRAGQPRATEHHATGQGQQGTTSHGGGH
jgi:protein-S-isoprenylcysteine O-methyltransferase Ste14